MAVATAITTFSTLCQIVFFIASCVLKYSFLCRRIIYNISVASVAGGRFTLDVERHIVLSSAGGSRAVVCQSQTVVHGKADMHTPDTLYGTLFFRFRSGGSQRDVERTEPVHLHFVSLHQRLFQLPDECLHDVCHVFRAQGSGDFYLFGDGGDGSCFGAARLLFQIILLRRRFVAQIFVALIAHHRYCHNKMFFGFIKCFLSVIHQGLSDYDVKVVLMLYPTGCPGQDAGIGGLIGVTENSDIESCTVLGGEIIGQSYVGGLIGDVNAGTVLHSRAACAVAAENAVGGLIGMAQQVGTITDCSATGNVILTGVRGSYAGGLIGGNSGNFSAQTIMACYATGTVTSDGNGPVNLGGLIGRNGMNGATQSIVLCYATGDVSSATNNRENCLGGLIGASQQQSTQSIQACYATGTVGTTGSYDKNVGGLFGEYELYDGVARMTGCYTTCNKGTYGFGTGSDETDLTLADVEIIAGPVTDKVSDMNRAAERFPYQYDKNAKIISR